MVMDKCKGGKDTKRTSITGRLSRRGHESYKRKMVGYRNFGGKTKPVNFSILEWLWISVKVERTQKEHL